MPDNTPDRVPFPVDDLTAVEGRETIQLGTPMKPASDEIAAAFRENFGITGGSTGDVDGGAPDSTFSGDGIDGGTP